MRIIGILQALLFAIGCVMLYYANITSISEMDLFSITGVILTLLGIGLVPLCSLFFWIISKIRKQ